MNSIVLRRPWLTYNRGVSKTSRWLGQETGHSQPGLWLSLERIHRSLFGVYARLIGSNLAKNDTFGNLSGLDLKTEREASNRRQSGSRSIVSIGR